MIFLHEDWSQKSDQAQAACTLSLRLLNILKYHILGYFQMNQDFTGKKKII